MNQIKKESVDFVISCGNACRPAYFIKLLGMRKFSSPCDWMMCYSLQHFLEIIDTRGSLMFRDSHIDFSNHWVKDNRTGMISMHDFNCNLPLSEQLPAFFEKMQRRANNTIIRISESSKVGLVMNRHISKDELLSFVSVLCKKFPHTFFHVINIKDVPQLKKLKTSFHKESQNYNICEICFDDAHKKGREKSQNPLFWHGNAPMWKHVLKKSFHVKGARSYVIRTNCRQLIKYVTNKIKQLAKLLKRLRVS